MPTRDQVLAAIGAECDYLAAERRLGIPAGQAYLVATGLPADGGDTFPPDEPQRPGVLATSTQRLVYASSQPENPTAKPHVHEWIKGRAAGEGGSEVQQSRRKSIVDMITVALSKHESSEQEEFWPVVRSTLAQGDGVAEQALHQEQEGKDVLDALGSLPPSEEEFDQLAEKLETLASRHVAFEDRVRDGAGDRPAKRRGKAEQEPDAKPGGNE